MTQINLLRQVKNLNFPEGFLINGQIVTSVSSGNLTVAIKTLSGTNPSTTDPVYCRIGGVVRSITSALSFTENAGNNHRNCGRSELATKEVDFFVYLAYDTANSVVKIEMARFGTGITMSDFVVSGLDEKGINLNLTSTDNFVNIGRISAILSAGPSYTWSIPATSVIINRPIFETRELDCIPILSGSTGSAGSYEETFKNGKYKIVGDQCFFRFLLRVNNVGSRTGHSLLKTPFGGTNLSDFILGSGGIMNGNNGTFKTSISAYNNNANYLNFSNNYGVSFGEYSVINTNDYIMGSVNYKI